MPHAAVGVVIFHVVIFGGVVVVIIILTIDGVPKRKACYVKCFSLQ
jgi:hypothetical protein